jgi:hypothetical protein
MSALTAIPGLNPEFIELLEGAGIRTAGALAKLSPVEAHKRLEMIAWQKGRVQQAPSLATVQQWVRQATDLPGALEEIPAALPAPDWDQGDDLPEVIVLDKATLPVKNVYVPPAQRARRATSASALPPMGIPLTSAENLPEAVPYTPAAQAGYHAPVSHLPAAAPLAPGPRPAVAAPTMAPSLGNVTSAVASDVASLPAALPTFTTFDQYEAGETRVAPLNRLSIDAPAEPLEPGRTMDRLNAAESLSRWVQLGVQHPSPGLLIIGAFISLLWRLAVLGALIGVPWLLLTAERGSDHRMEVLIAGGVLLVLGIAQLIIINKARCRICSCHLFYSRDCVKNRKAHHIFGLGFTASLALHLLIFQWFRCMYCGTAIRMWMSKRDS